MISRELMDLSIREYCVPCCCAHATHYVVCTNATRFAEVALELPQQPHNEKTPLLLTDVISSLLFLPLLRTRTVSEHLPADELPERPAEDERQKD